MNRWIWALRLRRRDRRVELLGGYPGPDPDFPVEQFTPVLGETERVQQALGAVARLGAESVDEATGHPLDNMINAQGDEWDRKLRQQHLLTFVPAAEQRLKQAKAVVDQYQQLRDADLTRLQVSEMALETALLALTGHEPEPAAGAARASRRIPVPAPRRRRAEPVLASTGLAVASPGAVQADRPGTRAALAPTKVSQAELRQLLDPQDARRAPRWGEPGFQDGTLLAGRPRSAYLHALVLVIAAGADVGAFVQIVELVLTLQDWVIWLVVCGLTAVVLYLAHMAGAMLREAKAGQRSTAGVFGRSGTWLGRRAAVFACTVLWLALGLMAFWIRMTVTVAPPSQVGVGTGIGSGGIGGGTAVSAAPAAGHTEQGAAIFLGLYLATGLVAALGAYFTHNPCRGRYAAAIRAFRKASERASASAYQLGRALALLGRQQAEIEAAVAALAEAQKQNQALAERLKQSVRIEIAGLARDPAVTDAVFSPDHRPYWTDPDGPPPSGNGPSPNGKQPPSGTEPGALNP
jgi:hypothetical protein